MPIGLTCSCGKQLLVADEFAGRQGRCPACGGLLEIPERDVVVRVADPSPLPAAQAVTATPGWAGTTEAGSPEYAVAPLAHEPAERLLEVPEVSRPEYKLFSPGAIGLVAFLAGPVGAFILLILNYWRLGKRGAAWITLALALVTTAAMVAISLALPTSIPSFLIGLPVFLALWSAAKTLQGNAYDAHRRKGGKSASGWTATGIAILGIVLYFSAVMGVFQTYDLGFSGGFGQKIDYGGEEVYYTKGGTEADARAWARSCAKRAFSTGTVPSPCGFRSTANVW